MPANFSYNDACYHDVKIKILFQWQTTVMKPCSHTDQLTNLTQSSGFCSLLSPMNNFSSASHILNSDEFAQLSARILVYCTIEKNNNFKAVFDLFTIVPSSLLHSCQILRVCRLVTQLAVSWGVTTVSSCVLARERVICRKLILMHVWFCDIVLLMRRHTPPKLYGHAAYHTVSGTLYRKREVIQPCAEHTDACTRKGIKSLFHFYS